MTDNKLTAFDKLKLKGIKMALDSALDYLDPGIEKLKELKANVKLEEGEVDIIVIGFFGPDDIPYGSIATINEENKIVRQITTAPIPDLIQLITKLI